jgi:hypothetical protein
MCINFLSTADVTRREFLAMARLLFRGSVCYHTNPIGLLRLDIAFQILRFAFHALGLSQDERGRHGHQYNARRKTIQFHARNVASLLNVCRVTFAQAGEKKIRFRERDERKQSTR